MIHRQTLLADLQSLLQGIEADLLQRSEAEEVPEVGQRLRGEYERAKKAERTAQNYEDWRSATITQNAAAWVLSCVFVRFLEDNRLVDPPKIAGPGERLRQARDEWELYLGKAKQPNERDYLLGVFDELARLPGAGDIFGEHNPVRELPNWLSGDGARELLTFFQRIDAETGKLVHDFTDPQWNTRFLGDLYQDLSEAARKRYALLQTPEFVEEFILERTLEPALDEFGLDGFKMIDPACGSAHFLLGAFRRILDRWRKKEPGAPVRELVGRALESIHGVDLNPYAVAIARFRLLLAAMAECGVTRLADCPAFKLNLACGDALLHGEGAPGTFGFDEYDHAYRVEDREELTRILRPGRYHAVAANPPYITPKDKALNALYRKRYSTCHMKYALTVPFMQRLFQLAVSGYGAAGQGGYVGQITSNSFMKREFGKKLIEQYLAGRDGGPSVDLTHVIDTSGAYIPGHGTPTVILFGRNQPAVGKTIRTVMGIRGEPSTPADPARGHVWSAIVDQSDRPGSQSEFVSVADSPREFFAKHPWSIGGGGAAELKEQLERTATGTLSGTADAGVAVVTLEDEAFQVDAAAARRTGASEHCFRGFVIGDTVRDWMLNNVAQAIFPHDVATYAPIREPKILCRLWPLRTGLMNRLWFRKTMPERGMEWFAYGHISIEKFRTPLSIVFAFVATHNHFVLDRGGKVFNRSAPVIKLPPEATEDDHLVLLGLLNSSTACFWMKQVFHDKGSSVDSHGARQTTIAFENFREFTATGLLQFPLPAGRPLDLARQLDEMAGLLAELSPGNLLRAGPAEHNAQILAERRFQWEAVRGQMIALQEELDWECYRLYELGSSFLVLCSTSPGRPTKNKEQRTKNKEPTSLPAIDLGERAFEIVLARRMARGEAQSTWFTRHGSTPRTELPDHWPDEYKRLVERRIELIETDPQISLIEQPEYKRRWNTEPWESQLERALREWLLDRLESYFDFDGRMGEGNEPQRRGDAKDEAKTNPLRGSLGDSASPRLLSTARLADVAGRDPQFMAVGELYRDDKAFDVQRLVEELVTAESVPLLPALRYKPSGLRKRAEWEKTWELQRCEDGNYEEVRSICRRDGVKAGADEQLAEHEVDWDALASMVTRIGNDGDEEAYLEKLTDCAYRFRDELLESGRAKVSDACRTISQELIGDIPVPPKYKSSDFQNATYWRLRGKLDVPKERWVSFPHCEGPDATLVIAWAGYNHLQLAQAISAYYIDVQERLGGRDDPRLVPLLACLIELVPWLKQWHNEPDTAFDGMRMGDYFEGFVQEEARQLGKTIPEIKAWAPPAKGGGRKKRKTN